MKNLDTPSMPTYELNGKDILQDTSYGLTKREQACITLGIPETGDPELDALILKSERKRIATLCMAAWINHHGSAGGYGYSSISAAKSATEDADALLEELSK